ncbi:MAG: glycosyltransferase family 2 protein [Nitriliruptor sp.]|nr:MAG: glycosyltransferase family 2 protein [Nitriliruptor sp.]
MTVTAPGDSPTERAPGPSLAVVFVTHDTRDEVLAALDAVAADPERPTDLEVVVVDAGSRDGTVAAVRARADGTRVLALVNTGFGRGANAGVRATSARFVLVANADVRVHPGALHRLAAALAAADDVAGVGPQVRYPSGALQASARRDLDASTVLGHAALGRLWPENPWTRRYHARDLPSDVPREVSWLSGCALLLRREAIESVGGFDPGYFLYVEDVDLGDRLRAAGWRLRYEPAAVVEHRVGASTSRARLRALWHHAVSLDRYLARRLRGAGRLLRPLLPVALATWVVVTALSERRGAARSTTGERLEVPGRSGSR